MPKMLSRTKHHQHAKDAVRNRRISPRHRNLRTAETSVRGASAGRSVTETLGWSWRCEVERCVSLALEGSPFVGYRAKMNRRLQCCKIKRIQCDFCEEIPVSGLHSSVSVLDLVRCVPRRTNATAIPDSSQQFVFLRRSMTSGSCKLMSWKVIRPNPCVRLRSRSCLAVATLQSSPKPRPARCPSPGLESLLDHPSHRAVARAAGPPLPAHASNWLRSPPTTWFGSARTTASFSM